MLEVDMDILSEIVPGFLDWVINRPAAILMLSATWPLMLPMKKDRLLGYGAPAVFIGAGTLIVFGIETPVGAVIVVLAYSLLVSVALFSTRRRLSQIEDRLASVISAIDDLEVAEERRQTYNARRPSRLYPRRKPAASTMEQVVTAGATESPGSTAQAIPSPPWQELQPPDPPVGSALPASTRPAGPDVLSEGHRTRLLSS
ncbi:MAG: hypothetical protein E5W63_04685 [Mesorhizobium sp.]|uniref:hypothetical protein n=2 Tax=Mesorhizobium TaxID=68287 RepID=UPI0010940527|nr:hypothetical protein [Mesorhizobium sp. M8A.F.Ca.ET.208.01.1.1]TIT69478.1 MAG: hypothetical protein E5W63_04685 [Mesorhizobium sp.]TIW87342.1 MAG: hypothetical protein E5V51_11045 [Mesorhizobium sp.]